MTTQYEWVIEQLDGPDSDDAEIIDVNHAPTYAEALQFAGQHPHARIGLVRDSDRDGRAWAYVENDALPPHLEDAFGHRAADVPSRFRDQFNASMREPGA